MKEVITKAFIRESASQEWLTIELREDKDAFRWYGANTEVSGATESEAFRNAKTAWAQWEFTPAYHASDGNADLICHARTVKDAASEYCSEGYEPEAKTYWVNVSVWQMIEDEDEDEIQQGDVTTISVEIDPKEPACTNGQAHEWDSPHSILGGVKENPGVWGHGGGVLIHEVCMRCGCGKTTDTWAQNRENGEQGLTSIEYEPGKYADKLEDEDEES